MKAKTKFDAKVIQQFFLDHAEKFVMGLVGVLFLFFAYKSYVTGVAELYTKGSKELASATESAAAKIEKGPATKTPENIAPIVPYADIVDGARTTIDPGLYPVVIRPYYKPTAPLRLRGVPQVLAVTQLRAIPGRGAVAKAGDAADRSTTTGKRWILLTGLIPNKQQLTEYRSKFEGTAEARDDMPRYVGYFVQRAEVVAGAAGEPKWSKFMIFPPMDPKEAAKLGDQRAEEIADPRFISSSVTSQLPLLADGTWGSEAVFPPEIVVVEKKADSEDAGKDGAAPPPPPGPRPGPKPRPVRPRPHQPGVGDPAPKGDGQRGADAGWDLADADAAKAEPEKVAPKEEEVPDYLLLRFFDLDVKPNKQYQYRVFLVLKNPNYQADASVLEDPNSALAKYISLRTPKPIKNASGEFSWPTTPDANWSLACTAERVPGDMRLLCGKVVAKALQEINAEVHILRWLESSGLNGNFTAAGLLRGTILNFPQAAVKTPGATGNTPTDLTPNCILVDVQGGEPLPTPRDRTLVSPGLIIVMDEFGNLVIHDEAAESDEWEKGKAQPDRPVPGPRGPRIRGGGAPADGGIRDDDLGGPRRPPRKAGGR